ncbi:hypothetical protein Tco_1296942 [Tanacetum coccineum]
MMRKYRGGITTGHVLGFRRIPPTAHIHSDYGARAIYPVFITLEDVHEFRMREQAHLLHVDLPTAESPIMFTEWIPMRSQKDDANDEDEDEEDEEDEEEEEHLAPADSTTSYCESLFSLLRNRPVIHHLL